MKKRKSLISAIGILLLITGFIFINPSAENSIKVTSPPSPNTIDSFMFGAMHTIADEPNYQDYEQLGLGVWHSYPLDDYTQIT